MIYITGITGHTGLHLINLLEKVEFKTKLKCLVRETSNVSNLESSNLDIDYSYIDLKDIDKMREEVQGCSTFVSIYNIKNSLNVLKAVENTTVENVILVHTTGIYSNFKEASSEYKNIEKLIYEIYKNSNIRITILRPSMIYGDGKDKNISKFIRFIDKLPIVPVVGSGNALIKPVHAKDLAQSIYLSIIKPNEEHIRAFDITGNEEISIIGLYKSIAKLLNKKRLFIKIPFWICLIAAKSIRLVSFDKIDIVEKIQRMTENRSYPNFEAVEKLDFKPISFSEGLLDSVERYKEKK